MDTVHFYTSCTQTKSAQASSLLSARSLRVSSVGVRFARWRDRLDSWQGERRTALELYRGGHWSVMRKLAVGRQLGLPKLRCHAISAGYGLVPTSDLLAPYAATFAVGHEDSVVCSAGKSASTENIEWWTCLTNWRPANIHGPRSLCKAFKASPDDVHLFAISPSYLDAISIDMLAGRPKLSNPEKLIVISTGKKRHGDLNDSIVSAPANLQSIVGGALTALNIRLASRVLHTLPEGRITIDETCRFVADLVKRAKPRCIPKRRDVSDLDVVRFLQQTACLDVNSSYTRMLTMFRAAGHACEMKRFKTIFQRVIAHHNNG